MPGAAVIWTFVEVRSSLQYPSSLRFFDPPDGSLHVGRGDGRHIEAFPSKAIFILVVGSENRVYSTPRQTG